MRSLSGEVEKTGHSLKRTQVGKGLPEKVSALSITRGWWAGKAHKFSKVGKESFLRLESV